MPLSKEQLHKLIDYGYKYGPAFYSGAAGLIANMKRKNTSKKTAVRKKSRTTTKATKTYKTGTPYYTPTPTTQPRRRRKHKIYKTINVKNDVTRYTKTYYKQKVTNQQQKKINRRFKDENNPFTYKAEYPIIDTVPQTTDTCKWIWQCHTGKDYLDTAWEKWINPGSGTVNAYNLDRSDPTVVVINQEQAIYFHTFKSKYEILNPTNYDMHVDIYDIVCKKDTYGKVTSAVYSVQDFNDPTDPVNLPQSNTYSDPVAMMNKGLEGALRGITSNYAVGDSTNMQLFDLQMTPTKSYPFNIYWTIVGKKRVTLQPGASMYHTFVHKPKALVQRGYWGYKFQYQNNPSNCAIEGITSGTLFKVWGQLAGDTHSSTINASDSTTEIVQDNYKAVVNLSGRIALKNFFTAKHYCMQPKAKYMFKYTDPNKWVPSDEEELDVVNNMQFQDADDEKAGTQPVDSD